MIQFLVKHSGFVLFSGRGTNSKGRIVTKGMQPKNRKHHVVPADIESEWQVEPHKMLRMWLGNDQAHVVPLFSKGKA